MSARPYSVLGLSDYAKSYSSTYVAVWQPLLIVLPTLPVFPEYEAYWEHLYSISIATSLDRVGQRGLNSECRCFYLRGEQAPALHLSGTRIFRPAPRQGSHLLPLLLLSSSLLLLLLLLSSLFFLLVLQNVKTASRPISLAV